MMQWKMDDDSANTDVLSNELDGVLVGANTVDVQTVSANGQPSFRLDGATQYVSIDVPLAWPSQLQDLWTKYAGNPVIPRDTVNNVVFGQVVANPSGGWYFYGAGGGNNIHRWESIDLINWSNSVTVLEGGGTGAWDRLLQVASCFQKPDGTWMLLYRGYDTSFQIGLATSVDGLNFTRKDNGGVDDGLFPQFGGNFDLIGVVLINNIYFVYLNGDPDHGASNVYYSTDDFNTFRASRHNPIFASEFVREFCSYVWKTGDYFYALVPRNMTPGWSNELYKMGIALYRCANPYFSPSLSEYLGYAIVNDQAYDELIHDTPSLPMTDIYRNDYAAEFGDDLHMIYAATHTSHSNWAQHLASLSLSRLTNLQRRVNLLYGAPVTLSMWVQFDTITADDVVFSMGNTPTDNNPQWLLRVAASGSDLVLALYLGGSDRLTTKTLAIDTPYHIAIVENSVNRKVYADGELVGIFTQKNTGNKGYVYLGAGYDNEFLDGHIWDFRVYPSDLTATEVDSLYKHGTISA